MYPTTIKQWVLTSSKLKWTWDPLTSRLAIIHQIICRLRIKRVSKVLLEISKQLALMQQRRLTYEDPIGTWEVLEIPIFPPLALPFKKDPHQWQYKIGRMQLIRFRWWDNITLTLVTNLTFLRQLLSDFTRIHHVLSKMLKFNCKKFIVKLFRANDAKNDLRKHHFDFGGHTAPMLTTH